MPKSKKRRRRADGTIAHGTQQIRTVSQEARDLWNIYPNLTDDQLADLGIKLLKPRDYQIPRYLKPD